MKGLMDLAMLLGKSAGPDVMLEQLKEALDTYMITKDREDRRKVEFYCMLALASCTDGTTEEFAETIEKVNTAAGIVEKMHGKDILPDKE